MPNLRVNDDTARRLRDRAAQENCSVDELLDRLLAVPSLPYQDILNQTSDLVAVLDLDLHYLYINPHIEAIIGSPPQDMINRTPREVGSSAASLVDQWESVIQATITTGQEKMLTFDTTIDGEIHTYEARLTPILNGDGAVQQVLAIIRDITGCQRVEAELRRAEAYLLATLNSASQFNLMDRDGRIIAVDEQSKIAVEAISGKWIQPGDAMIDYVLQHERETFQRNFARALAGERVIIERSFPNQHGGALNFEATYYPVIDKSGAIIGVCMSGVDLTEHKRAEETLRRTEARLRSLLETQTAFVVRCDLDGKYTYTNRAFTERYRWLGSDLVGRSIRELIHPDDQRKTALATQKCLAEPGKPVQVIMRKTTPDDSPFWTVWEFVALQEADGTVNEIQCMGFDITKERLAEEALRQSEERYRIISELVSDYAYACRVEPDGTIAREWVTDVYFQLTGYTNDDPEYRVPYQMYHPDDREQVRLDVERMLQGREVSGEYRIYTASGELRWFHIYRRPSWDEQEQRVVRFYGVVRDITAEKQSEQIRLEHERLKASLKKEEQFNVTVQKAVSVLAHDVRIPLTVIASAKDLLERYYDRLDEKTRREKLDSIGKQLRYVIELLDEVILTVRGNLNTRSIKLEPVNLVALCQVSLDTVQEAQESTHPLRFVTDEQVTTVQIDETLVSRILLNLLSNAVKFSPPESEIRLELERSDDWVILRVTDYGIGIAATDQPHIFDPFFRTNAAQEIRGTGLGLYIVKDAVERHQGHIEVSSAEGQGTTFIVRLPLVSA